MAKKIQKATYVCDSNVTDSEGNFYEMNTFKDETSGCIFSIDFSYLEQVIMVDLGEPETCIIKSPINGKNLLLVYPD